MSRLSRLNRALKSDTAHTLTLMALMGEFVLSVYLVSLNPPWAVLRQELWVLPLLGLAAFRGAVAVSENTIFSWLRRPFAEATPDSCGAGDSVNPKAGASGVMLALGELIACPICSGTWAANVLFTLYAFAHDFGLVLIIVLGAAALNELFVAAREALSWSGRWSRVQAGAEERHHRVLRDAEVTFLKERDARVVYRDEMERDPAREPR